MFNNQITDSRTESQAGSRLSQEKLLMTFTFTTAAAPQGGGSLFLFNHAANSNNLYFVLPFATSGFQMKWRENEENRCRLLFGLTGEIHFSVQILNLRCQAELEKVQAACDDIQGAD